MNSSIEHPLLIGCSGWSYPDWLGPFYPPGLHEGDFLEYYADRFPIVEVDSTFYRPPSARMVRSWRDRTPDQFTFALKVPRVITHEKLLKGCEEEVDGFVSSLEPLGEKLACALLQMGYFNRSAFGTRDEFLEVLDRFLSRWPMSRVPLAVEVRNAQWVGPELAGVLEAHGAALTLTEQAWMPSPREVADRIDPVTGPFAFVRLLGDRQGIERITTTWDRIVIDRSAELAETAGVIRQLVRRVPVFVFANNHYAGFSPETARQLRGLLGLPEPTPPDRPRRTLFD
ncbi:DUF72 domain-containing protein [Tautonia sociabilis]|uniref:DUF72 domain-containing protein n=1 Tax=Tautonia sociabilis TaxID=2080755 RepID=A0A432MQK2_9BACT|nr:DUF72 domain-containing protein [Tautonia sociabilis]RUL89722.1 DUF72 domain-containing protein [Tautonia sociabilis]